jgi:hypothetical protein
MEIDFRTTKQKKRDERDKKIYSRYIEIKKTSPKAKEWAIWRVIANELTTNEFKIHPQSVRYAIERQQKKEEKIS